MRTWEASQLHVAKREVLTGCTKHMTVTHGTRILILTNFNINYYYNCFPVGSLNVNIKTSGCRRKSNHAKQKRNRLLPTVNTYGKYIKSLPFSQVTFKPDLLYRWVYFVFCLFLWDSARMLVLIHNHLQPKIKIQV